MIIYTDGSSHGNPGPGGFGVIVLDDNEQYITHHSEQIKSTTNNREELKAILWTFLKYGAAAGEWERAPIVYSDSAYCVNVFNNWMFQWANHGWRKSDKQEPENMDLILPYYRHYQEGYRIDLRKIKGHSGNQWNEAADALATGKIKTGEKLY